MTVNIESLGLKSDYIFKETHIATTHDRNDIYQKLRQIVAPAIRDLESKKLINGFHYIVYKDIDLRLSCENWNHYELEVSKVLSIHSIPTNLVDWGPMPNEQYGGKTGVLLCYNNLEYNSRLSLALVELLSETNDQAIHQTQERLCPHQWVHYLCNQCGYLNQDQIVFELNDAFAWLGQLIDNNGGNPQVISWARNIIVKFRNAATQFEKDLLNS